MPPIVTVVGLSNSGKTTLIEKLLPELRSRGYRIGTVKHALHGFEIDREGKDSWRHQAAGADAVVLVSQKRIAMVRHQEHDGLDAIAPMLGDMDLIVAEGFKTEDQPKIEVLRSEQGRPPLFFKDPNLAALVTDLDISMPRDATFAVFSLDEVVPLADLIERLFLKSSITSNPASNPPNL